jgi:hypothetical protein
MMAFSKFSLKIFLQRMYETDARRHLMGSQWDNSRRDTNAEKNVCEVVVSTWENPLLTAHCRNTWSP